MKSTSQVNWCFEPCQPLGIISGLKETFIKWYTVERTNKARRTVWKQRLVRRIYEMKYSWKGQKDRNRHLTEQKGAGKLGWFMSNINRNIPTTWRWARGDWKVQHIKDLIICTVFDDIKNMGETNCDNWHNGQFWPCDMHVNNRIHLR